MRTRYARGEGFDFAPWLRTGRLIRSDARLGAREVKFNPNHDPDNGRFTFKDGGGGVDDGADGDDADGASSASHDPHDPANYTLYIVQPGDTLHHIAATRVGLTPDDLEWLNDLDGDEIEAGRTLKVPTQDFLDQGKRAFDTVNALNAYSAAHGGALPLDVAHPPSLKEQAFGPGTHEVSKNGYDFTIDGEGRTREVDGVITLNPDQGRSRTAQAQAGGDDRLPTDEGGHYIARRFDGPTDAFNHFAQDGNFNRGAYARLENGWAKATNAGEKVYVSITPFYGSSSIRPSSLEIETLIGGVRIEKTLRTQGGRLMFNDAVAETLTKIGERMSKMGEPGSGSFFLYVETEEGVHHPMLVQEFVDRVQDVSLSPVSSLLYVLWTNAEPRWGALHFELTGEKFAAKFDYDVDPADGLTNERSLAAVKARFPDKPLVYLSREDYRRQQVRHQALFSG